MRLEKALEEISRAGVRIDPTVARYATILATHEGAFQHVFGNTMNGIHGSITLLENDSLLSEEKRQRLIQIRDRYTRAFHHYVDRMIVDPEFAREELRKDASEMPGPSAEYMERSLTTR